MRSLRSLILRWCDDGRGDDEMRDEHVTMIDRRRWRYDAGRAFSCQLRLVPPNLVLPPNSRFFWLTAPGFRHPASVSGWDYRLDNQPVGAARAASRNVFLIFTVRLCVRRRSRWLLSARCPANCSKCSTLWLSGAVVLASDVCSDLIWPPDCIRWCGSLWNETNTAYRYRYRNTWIPFLPFIIWFCCTWKPREKKSITNQTKNNTKT